MIKVQRWLDNVFEIKIKRIIIMFAYDKSHRQNIHLYFPTLQNEPGTWCSLVFVLLCWLERRCCTLNCFSNMTRFFRNCKVVSPGCIELTVQRDNHAVSDQKACLRKSAGCTIVPIYCTNYQHKTPNTMYKQRLTTMIML